MRPLVRPLILVLVVMALFTGAIFPPERNLKLGKDLSGGVSLIYSISVGPGEDAGAVIARTIDVLRQRVDPQGLFEISMVASGRDRIEITMPLPNQRVKQLRAQYEQALADIGRQALSARDFERLMAMDQATRASEIARIATGNDILLQHLQEAAAAFDQGRDAARQVAEAIDASAPDEQIDALAARKALADQSYVRLRRQVLESALNADMVRQALNLPNRSTFLRDDALGRVVEIPSDRARAIAELRERYPDARASLDQAIARYDAYAKERRTLDDPQDLVRLLRGAGVLTFRITVDPGQHPEEARLRQAMRESGPASVPVTDARWYKINKPRQWYDSVQKYQALQANPQGYFANMGYVVEPWAGEYYMLCWDVRGSRLTPAEGDWAVSGASQSSDSKGRPGIGFQMDPRGATKLSELTGAHVNDSMAVLLDDEVYTAPNLNSQISSSGIIEGNFDPEELQYIVQVLSAGSLQAKLSREPISMVTIGPELGMDNLQAGLRAGYWAFIIVSIFMVVYYFLYGVVAVVALLSTALLVLGAMALQGAAFSLPGIAGVVLTFGQAIDANVLVYERTREELRAGKDLRTSIRLGYERAFASIVDGNLTNLIVCVVLLMPGIATPEIKGFALTLGLGVLATLFAGLVISRLIFDIMLVAGIRKMSMLPLAIPFIERMLTFKINWLRYRWVFAGIALSYMLVSIILVASRGERMLDNEFLGGTKVTLSFRDGPDGQPLTLTRADVQDRLRALIARTQEQAATLPPDGQDNPETLELRQRAAVVALLATAEVLPVNPQADGVTSARFTIKTLASDPDTLLGVLTSEFQDVLDVKPAYRFQASNLPEGDDALAPAYAVLAPVLGQNLGDIPALASNTDDVSDYIGGVAVILRDIQPRPSLKDLRDALEVMRQKPDFSSTLGRTHEIRVIEGTDQQVHTAVLLSRDDSFSFFDSQERWSNNVRRSEWNLVVQGLTNPTTLAQVENFSPAVADTIRGQAVAAVVLSCLLILIYVWVRFGSIRYSLAAIACTLHDIVTVVGVLALCQLLHDTPSGGALAQSVGILPFKIDLNMVAALLTIIGFSLNGGIIVLDRIREMKGKLPYETADMINGAINITISRTVITSGTTLFSSVVLFTVGGEGVRAFSFALTVGVFVATYSGMAIVAPIVWSAKRDKSLPPKATDQPALPPPSQP